MEKIVIAFIPVFSIFIFPLLFLGIINRVKAVWGGRKGASVLQPFYNFFRLLKKGEVISECSSFVLSVGPTVSLAALVGASLVVPVGSAGSVLSFNGDFIFFASMLALSKFALVLNALDTGSSFEGMGASREVTFTALVEPGFYMMMASVSWITGYSSMSKIGALSFSSGSWPIIIALLVAAALFIMMVVEGCRIPVDDPNTHLELTMIHEVMVLDNSGVDLAYTLFGSGLKLSVIASLIVSIFIPATMPLLYSSLIFAAGIAGCAVIIGIVESLRPRLRMNYVPEFALLMISVAFIVLAGTVMLVTGGPQ